jgi:predicted transcriptional regulator
MNTAEDITTSPTKSSRPMMIPIERLLQLKGKNLTDQEVATILGCNRSNVSRRLKQHAPRLQRIDNYKKYRADILVDLQIKALDNVTDAKLKDSSATQLITGMAILYDKERIERGLSTSNLSIAGVIETHQGNLEGISDTIARLTQELDVE